MTRRLFCLFKSKEGSESTGNGSAKKDPPYRSEIYKRDQRTKYLWRKLRLHVKMLSKQAALLSM